VLSVPLGPCQSLYTRKGSLIGIRGVSEKIQLKLFFLLQNPFHGLLRTTLGVPFAYTKLVNSSSTDHVAALIVPLSGHLGLYVLRLDGTKDYIISQRNALLSWSSPENSLSIRPKLNTGQGLSNYGYTGITGRGEVCLSGFGDIIKRELEDGEEEILSSRHVVAYTVSRIAPVPVRLDDIPRASWFVIIRTWLLRWEFFRVMAATETIRWISRVRDKFQASAEKVIWGDRHFTRFVGPATLLVQTRSSRPRSYVDSPYIAPAASPKPTPSIADQVPAQHSEPGVLDTTVAEAATISQAGLWDPSTLKLATVSQGKARISEAQKTDDLVMR
ncbi:Altered inheritance of mitochondria protein 24, mitochondrial, partial [Neolecta irregularis DAH-3]